MSYEPVPEQFYDDSEGDYRLKADRDHEFLIERHTIIKAALSEYVENMNKAAKEARDAVDYYDAHPDKARALDEGNNIMTVNGYRQAAQMFADSRDSAEKALEELNEFGYM